MDTKKSNVLIKLVIVGNSSVGKTNLLIRYIDDKFEPSQKATIGIDFLAKDLVVDSRMVKVQFWDTAGQEKYKAVTNSSYKFAHGIIFVYDVTSRHSFQKLGVWLETLNNSVHQTVKLMLIGNKIDLLEEREVSASEGELYAKTNNMYFWETSALSNQGKCVQKAFDALIEDCLKDHLRSEAETGKLDKKGNELKKGISEINGKKEEKPKCC